MAKSRYQIALEALAAAAEAVSNLTDSHEANELALEHIEAAVRALQESVA